MMFFDTLAETFDLPILDWIAEHLHCGFLDAVMPVITALGDGGIFWIGLAVLFMFLPRYRKTGFSMALALIFGLIVCNLILKPWVGRIRPYDYQWKYFQREILLLVERPHDFAFPSGHTIASFEAAVAIALRHKKLGIAAVILACLISFSRLYLYVHYPTDVLASILLGTAFAFLASWIVNQFFLQKAEKEPGL